MASKSYKFGKKNFTTSTKKFVPGWKKNVKRYNGTVEAEAIEVTWSDIDISNRRNQCRQTDTVEGHVSELAISIFNNGLNIAPTVEWDSSLNKFVVLSGHHRLLAQKKLTEQVDDKGKPKQLDNFIVHVVKFSNEVGRLDYLHAENQHEPRKKSARNDAVMYLQDHLKLGSFAHLAGDPDRTHNLARALLKNMYGGSLSGTSYKAVIAEALGAHAVRVLPSINYEGWEMEDQAKAQWGDATLTSGKNSRGDKCYVLQPYRAYRGVVFGAGLERAMAIGRNQATNPMTIKVMTHVRVPTNTRKPEKTLQKTRRTMLDELKYCNTDYAKKTTSIIDEVVFLPQVRGAEKNNIVYNWNKNAKEFELLT